MKTAYLDWFIGNKRVMRHVTTLYHPCLCASVGECRKLGGKMYRIKSIMEINAFNWSGKPYIKRFYLTPYHPA